MLPGHKGIEENEIADQLAREGSTHPLTAPEPAVGISAEFTGGVIRRWTNKQHEKYWQSIHGQGQTKCFL
jgi:hypothetical protein